MCRFTEVDLYPNIIRINEAEYLYGLDVKMFKKKITAINCS